MEVETLECPKCGGKLVFRKSWTLKGKGSHKTILKLYGCEKCGATLRIPTKGES